MIRSKSTLYDAEGSVRVEWVISNADDMTQSEGMREAVAQTLPALSNRPFNTVVNNDLYNLNTITDAQVGALCSKEVGGADWDLKIVASLVIRPPHRRLPARHCNAK